MRLLSAIVCDDIRTETSGKDIIIGCYNNVLLIPRVPYLMTSLSFRLMFDQEPAGNHQSSMNLYGPAGNLIFRTGGEVLVEEADEPFVIRIVSAPFNIESFGKYELRHTRAGAQDDDKGTLILEFIVRLPKTDLEKERLPFISA